MDAWPLAATTLRRSSPRDTLPKRSARAVACGGSPHHHRVPCTDDADTSAKAGDDHLQPCAYGLHTLIYRAGASATLCLRGAVSLTSHVGVSADLCVVGPLLADAACIRFRLGSQVGAFLALGLHLRLNCLQGAMLSARPVRWFQAVDQPVTRLLI